MMGSGRQIELTHCRAHQVLVMDSGNLNMNIDAGSSGPEIHFWYLVTTANAHVQVFLWTIKENFLSRRKIHHQCSFGWTKGTNKLRFQILTGG